MKNEDTLKHLETVVDELKTTIQSLQESSKEIDHKESNLEEEIKEVSNLPIGTIVTSDWKGKETHVIVLGKNKGLLLLDDSAVIINTDYEEALRQGATISYSLPKYVGICLSDEKVVGEEPEDEEDTESDEDTHDEDSDEYSEEDPDDDFDFDDDEW